MSLYVEFQISSYSFEVRWTVKSFINLLIKQRRYVSGEPISYTTKRVCNSQTQNQFVSIETMEVVVRYFTLSILLQLIKRTYLFFLLRESCPIPCLIYKLTIDTENTGSFLLRQFYTIYIHTIIKVKQVNKLYIYQNENKS